MFFRELLCFREFLTNCFIYYIVLEELLLGPLKPGLST